MPQTSKLAWAKLRVGVMTVVAIAITVVVIFLLTGQGGLFRRMARLRTYVDDSASLKVGAAVRLNGIDLGNVEAVRLSGSSDARRTIEIVMQVARDQLSSIPNDSQSAINPEGVFGDKYINITRGQSAAPVEEGGEIRSLDTRDFPELMNASHTLLGYLTSITRRIDSITAQVEQGKGTIGKLLYDDTLVKKIDGVVDRTQKVVDLIAGGQGTIGRLLTDDQLYQQANTTMRRMDTMMAGLQAGNGTLGMLLNDPTLYQNANGTIAETRKLVQEVNAGQGTLGKLLKDESVHKQIQATLGRVDHTMDRLNSGQGTLGQLLVNRVLYDNLAGMTGETQKLMQDFRANPKKFLRIKLGLF